MAARLTISPVVPAISSAFGVSNAAIGLALMGMWLAYAAAPFPGGLLADRFGERVIILVSVVGTALACASLAVSPTYVTFTLSAFVLGGVAGRHVSVATSLLTRAISRTGSAIGIHSAGAPRRARLAATAPLSHPAAPRSPAHRPHRRSLCDGRLRVAGHGVVPSRLPNRVPRFGTAHAGVLFSVYFAVQDVAQPALGTLSDRIGRYPAAALVVGLGVVGFVALVVSAGNWTLGLSIVAVGLAMSWGTALSPAVMDHLDEDERSAGFGLIRTAYMVLGTSGSAAAGAAADVFGWDITFLGLAGLLAVMLGILGSAIGRPVARPAQTPS